MAIPIFTNSVKDAETRKESNLNRYERYIKNRTGRRPKIRKMPVAKNDLKVLIELGEARSQTIDEIARWRVTLGPFDRIGILRITDKTRAAALIGMVQLVRKIDRKHFKKRS